MVQQVIENLPTLVWIFLQHKIVWEWLRKNNIRKSIISMLICNVLLLVKYNGQWNLIRKISLAYSIFCRVLYEPIPYNWIDTYLVSKNSSIPWCPPSLPNPLCLKPPNGACAVEGTPSLIPTIPYSSFSETYMAVFKLSV